MNYIAKKIALQEKNILNHADLYLDYNNRIAFHKNRKINLTVKEFDILFFLASYPGQVFTHRQIYETVWGKLATMAIEQLIERGEYPSVTLLVKKTGLSRGFFYKNPEVRSRLDAAVQSPNVSCRRIWSRSKDSKNDNTEVLQMEIMEYKVRNRSLSQENEELRGQIEELKVQVEKLKGSIKKKELSMLKKL